MTLYSPCIKAVGPTSARLFILGEAPGATEEETGLPFMGHAGNMLNDLLAAAEISREESYLTNVLWTRPPNNKLEEFLVPKSDPFAVTQMPALRKGLYLKNDFLPELERLRDELRRVRPNLILALGNTAAWAVLGQTAISKIRGTVIESPYGKVLPTYHPAAIFRQWDQYPILAADILKARRELEYPEIRRPRRIVHIDPTLEEIRSAIDTRAPNARFISCDIETSRGQITTIGFGFSRDYALVIPLVDSRKPSKSYWSTLQTEVQVYKLIQEILLLPQPKIFQNGLYDLQYIRRYGWRVLNANEDTMLMHHALQPEMLKGLGFLGSIYTDEPAWKLMRSKGEDQLKRDDE
jgi:uracil-DNA glycosylase